MGRRGWGPTSSCHDLRLFQQVDEQQRQKILHLLQGPALCRNRAASSLLSIFFQSRFYECRGDFGFNFKLQLGWLVEVNTAAELKRIRQLQLVVSVSSRSKAACGLFWDCCKIMKTISHETRAKLNLIKSQASFCLDSLQATTIEIWSIIEA